jgi:hypothetical protein
MLRVALGRARPETEWSTKISGLEFNSNPGGGTGTQASTGRSRSHDAGTRGGFGINTILTVTRSHLEPGVDVEPRRDGSSLDAITAKANLDAVSLSKQEVEGA